MSAEALAAARRALQGGRWADALALTTPLQAEPSPSHLALSTHADALKAAGRLPEALATHEHAVRLYGATSAVAWHNVAATLGDLGRGAAAVDACERALAMGLDAPQTHLVLARARLAQGRHAQSEAAFRAALARAPADHAIAGEVANLVWMLQGRLDAAQAVIDSCLGAGGDRVGLVMTFAEILRAGGEAERAAGLLRAAAAAHPAELRLQLAACQAALETGALAAAEGLLAQAQRHDSDARAVRNQQIILKLALGRADQALADGCAALALWPDDQSLLCWTATAARIVGDPLAEALLASDLVSVHDLSAPPGWSSMTDFLTDLSAALRPHHPDLQHPADQSVRGGSQTLHLLTGDPHPAIQAFFASAEAVLVQRLAGIGRGEGVVRRRNTGGYTVKGAWSVRLRSGGHHTDHFHSEGWLSCVFYVETPRIALAQADKAGWLRLGQPALATCPPLQPTGFLRPQPGRLVVFPSYYWHGTVPFSTAEDRVSIAFDIVPTA
jgi:tetratricopeptide (TPR) repeat protein